MTYQQSMASAFDLFKLGVGPSSSHTMGPMTAGGRFLERLSRQGLLAQTTRVEIALYASLALTGRGHATDRAVILGLAGFIPATIDPDAADAALATIRASSGSACTSGSLEPSHVMRAMGIPYTAAHGTIRFSLSRYTTEAEIERVIEAVPPIIAQLRKLSPYWSENGPVEASEQGFAPAYA